MSIAGKFCDASDRVALSDSRVPVRTVHKKMLRATVPMRCIYDKRDCDHSRKRAVTAKSKVP